MVKARGDPRNHAIITAEETLARASDFSNAPARFAEPLPGGTEIDAIELRDRWARIRLANDREAWVNRRGLEMVFGSPSAAVPSLISDRDPQVPARVR